MPRSHLRGTFRDFFIFGMAPSSGMLSPVERRVVLDAIEQGMHIVNGLHEFLNDDPEFAAAATAHNVTILDVRRPRDKKNLRMFSGHISTVTCPRIAVLGTDGAIGKRTTATILTRALNERGIKAVLVGHRADRPHPGRPLRRGARRHPVPVLLGRDGGQRWSRRSKASTRT